MLPGNGLPVAVPEGQSPFSSRRDPVLAWRRGASAPVCTGFSPSLAPTLPAPHLCVSPFSGRASREAPGFWGACRFRGSRFSFSALEPKGWGARAPCQHLMGHLLLRAVCPKAPQCLHFTCGRGGGGSASRSPQAREGEGGADVQSGIDLGREDRKYGKSGTRRLKIFQRFPKLVTGRTQQDGREASGCRGRPSLEESGPRQPGHTPKREAPPQPPSPTVAPSARG